MLSNKRYLHHVLTRLRLIRYRYLLIASLFMFIVFIFAYRQNNITALKLRDQLLEVDKQNGDTEAALRKLREFTYTHMNANLATNDASIYPPIQLKYRYERLLKAEQDKLAAANARLYTDAQTYCEQQVTSRVTINRVPCIQEYLASHGVNTTVTTVPDALYKFDFVSPVWSPDLAGWSLVACVLALLALLGRYATATFLRHQLRKHD